MNAYIYPQNLKAKANLWLWNLKDFSIFCIMLLLSVLILSQTKLMLPLVVTVCFGFLSIRADDTTILEYIKYAFKYFISSQQYFEWQPKYYKLGGDELEQKEG